MNEKIYTKQIKEGSQHIEEALKAEIEYLKNLSSSTDTIMASSNLSVYEVVLRLLQHRENGLPVYAAIKQNESRFSSDSGILKRIKILREHGLIVAHTGGKKSEVYLRPSDTLLSALIPIIAQKYKGRK